jgi:hypothetical protein
MHACMKWLATFFLKDKMNILTHTHTYTHACAAAHACLHEVIGNILLKGYNEWQRAQLLDLGVERLQVCVCVCMCTCICVHVFAFVHSCLPDIAFVFVYVCVCEHMRVHVRMRLRALMHQVRFRSHILTSTSTSFLNATWTLIATFKINCSAKDGWSPLKRAAREGRKCNCVRMCVSVWSG